MVKKLNRIAWLDTVRGLAIILLIAVHYTGALEARGLISNDLYIIVMALLKVATPFFILIFGFTFSIAYKSKVQKLKDAVLLIYSLKNRLLKILLARELIVVISYFKYDEINENLLNILFYGEFSPVGEILTFYFIAILLAPFVLILLNKLNSYLFFLLFTSIYFISLLIVCEMPVIERGMLFSLLFYDVYPIFMFLPLSAVGMLIGSKYLNAKDIDLRDLVIFVKPALFLLVASIVWLFCYTDNPIKSLAYGVFKVPPQPIYMFFYSGLSLLFMYIVSTVNRCGKFIGMQKILSIIGRNSLNAYILHYSFYLSTDLAYFVYGKKSIFIEFVFLLLIVFISAYIIIKFDKVKLQVE